jgi:enoyl-CoA hydratase/carnithine racemase
MADYDPSDGIATITLSRPQVLNALTLEMCAGLGDLFAAFANDGAVRLVIITGTGRGFCSVGTYTRLSARCWSVTCTGT